MSDVTVDIKKLLSLWVDMSMLSACFVQSIEQYMQYSIDGLHTRLMYFLLIRFVNSSPDWLLLLLRIANLPLPRQ